MDLHPQLPDTTAQTALIDAAGPCDDARFGGAVGAVLAAIDASGALAVGIAILGSHGLAVYAAIAGALRRARRVVFLDRSADLVELAPILVALDVSIVLDCVSATGTPGLHVIDVREHPPGRAAERDGRVAPLTCDEYAILTSGTTGEAKVILQSFANLRGHIANYVGYVGILRGDRVLQLASAGWDAGLMDIFACLLYGGIPCSIDPRAHDLATVRQFIIEHAVDVLHMTVPYFRLMHADPDFVHTAPRRLVIGGELITQRDLARFERAMPPGAVLFNAYGPTECTTALYNVHRRGDDTAGATWPLAFGVPGVITELALGGAAVREPHVTGELLLASTLVARRFDVATRRAVSLVEDVLGDGTAYYATGDLAHRDEAGRIVITGRKDSVIKVNGQKVSLYEIEAVLGAMPGVADACVVVEPAEPDAIIIAAVVLADSTADGVGLAQLRRELAQRLSAHKLPKQLLRMAALPLNRNNKIDRQRLLELAATERSTARSSAQAAEPGTGSLVADVQRVLRGAPVNPALSFIENGGDSLRALSLVAALKRVGRKVSLEQLMSSMPIGSLASERHAATRAPARGGADRGIELALPNRAFLEGRAIPDLDGWNQAVVFDYTGTLPATELARIARAVLARHFPGQVPVVPVTAARFADEVAALSPRISHAAGRIVEAAVVDDAAGLHVIIACHQFVIDRTSWIILAGELADGVRQGLAGIAAWPLQDPDRHNWVSMYLRHRSADRASDIWSSLPWESSRPLVRPAPIPPRSAFHRVTTELVGTASRGPAGRTDDALLAAVLIAAAETTGHGCHPMDILGHGRDLTVGGMDASGIVGWFTVIWPLVLDVTGLAPADVVRALSALRARLAPIAYTFGNEQYRYDVQPRWRCAASYNFLGDVEISRTEELAVNPISIQTMHGAASHSLEVTGYRIGSRVQLVIDHDPAVLPPAAATALASAIGRTFSTIEVP